MTRGEMKMRPDKRREGQDGSVMLIVFIVLLLASFLGMSLLFNTDTDFRASKNYNDSLQALTDGDSAVWFRGADVISTGDIFATNGYPMIDLERRGSIQGVIDGLNRILDLAFPEFRLEGGTMVIPGHGRLADEADVVEYRDMITIIRDRIQDVIKKGMTLEQVKAARPTRDYDGRYGDPNAMIEAAYREFRPGNIR